MIIVYNIIACNAIPCVLLIFDEAACQTGPCVNITETIRGDALVSFVTTKQKPQNLPV